MGYNFQRDAESPKHPPCNCPTELQLQTHDSYLVFQCSGYIKGNRKICWNSNFNISDVFQTFQNIKSETCRTNQRNSSLLWFLLIEIETGIRIAKAREFLSQKSYQPKKNKLLKFSTFFTTSSQLRIYLLLQDAESISPLNCSCLTVMKKLEWKTFS